MSIVIFEIFCCHFAQIKEGLFYKNVQFDERLPKRAWTFFSLRLKIKINYKIFLTEIKNQNQLWSFSHWNKNLASQKFSIRKFDWLPIPMV